jgi:hypothetical protein
MSKRRLWKIVGASLIGVLIVFTLTILLWEATGYEFAQMWEATGFEFAQMWEATGFEFAQMWEATGFEFA